MWFVKGDSPQCGEMWRSDRGDGRSLGGVERSETEGLTPTHTAASHKKDHPQRVAFLLAIDIYFVSKRNSVVVVKGTPALTNSTGKLGQ